MKIFGGVDARGVAHGLRPGSARWEDGGVGVALVDSSSKGEEGKPFIDNL